MMLVLTACGTPASIEPPSPAPPDACLLSSQQPMLIAELFFGRNIRGRAPLSEAEWADFAAQIVTPNFPDGFTAFDGDGQWQNPATGQISREGSKILLVAAKRSRDLAARLSAVIEAYKTRFNQQSVGIVTRQSCAAF